VALGDAFGEQLVLPAEAEMDWMLVERASRGQ
jgi:hypothetical protein